MSSLGLCSQEAICFTIRRSRILHRPSEGMLNMNNETLAVTLPVPPNQTHSSVPGNHDASDDRA